MTSVFISYRRRDSRRAVKRLADRFRGEFGPKRVFLDVHDLGPAEDVPAVIDRLLDSSTSCAVIIGPGWLEASNEQGRRLDQKDDWVRKEIERAFEKNVKVVPVLVDGASMPERDQLPEGLRRLADLNAVELHKDSYEADVALLIATLRSRSLLPLAGLCFLGGLSGRFVSGLLQQLIREDADQLAMVIAKVLGSGIFWGLLATAVAFGLRTTLGLRGLPTAKVGTLVLAAVLVSGIVGRLVAPVLLELELPRRPFFQALHWGLVTGAVLAAIRKGYKLSYQRSALIVLVVAASAAIGSLAGDSDWAEDVPRYMLPLRRPESSLLVDYSVFLTLGLAAMRFVFPIRRLWIVVGFSLLAVVLVALLRTVGYETAPDLMRHGLGSAVRWALIVPLLVYGLRCSRSTTI